MRRGSKTTWSKPDKLWICFSYKKKLIPITKIVLKVGQIKQSADIGETLYEMANVFWTKTKPKHS